MSQIDEDRSWYRVLQNRHPAGIPCPLCRTPPSPSYLPYFRGEQEWEFRVGGMVSRALTANDPLNDQRERGRETKRQSKMVRKVFNNVHVNVFVWIVISFDQFLMCATFSVCGVGQSLRSHSF